MGGMHAEHCVQALATEAGAVSVSILCTPAVLCCGVQVPVALVQEVLKAQEGTADLLFKYDRFAMRSFVEDNRALVWCTGNSTPQLLSKHTQGQLVAAVV
jgi:hypothetical protein